MTSDICEYEVRRSLILASFINPMSKGIENLDELQQVIDFLPLTKNVMREAALLWAEARSQGIPTADNKNIDADIIIAAQCKLLTEEFPGRYIVPLQMLSTWNVLLKPKIGKILIYKSIFNMIQSNSRTNREALESMSDSDIDYSDIPPLTDEFFDKAVLRVPATQAKNNAGGSTSK